MISITLTVIRHGQTTGNKQKIMQGHMDFPLTELGRTQAKYLATRLQSEKYSHIYSSDLNRAFETAQIIARNNDYYDVAEIKTDLRLRERNYGELEGKFLSEVKEITRGQSLLTFTPKGAETVEQVRDRAGLFFNSLLKDLSDVNRIPRSSDFHVLLVSHGGFIKELVTYLVEKKSCDIPGGKKEASKISPNTGLSKFIISGNSFEDAKISCSIIHDQSHLTENGLEGDNFCHRAGEQAL